MAQRLQGRGPVDGGGLGGQHIGLSVRGERQMTSTLALMSYGAKLSLLNTMITSLAHKYRAAIMYI